MSEVEFSFTRDRDDSQLITDHLKPLPRSVVRRNEYELLDGEWRFEVDPEDKGLKEKWYLGHEFTGTALWPSSIEEQMASAQAQQGAPVWHDEVVAWYERDFQVPENWTADPDTLVQITFGACGYETRVWLNGHALRTIEGEAVHYGEWSSFSYELPPRYLQPVNRLTVRIADSMDAEVTRGKQESRVYKRGGIWYQTISGAVRSIWIEPVERNRLRSRLGVTSIIEDRLVEFNFTTRIHDRGIYTLRLAVAERPDRSSDPERRDGEGEEPIALSEYRLPPEAGEKKQSVVMELPDALLWSPEAPHLYYLVAQLIHPSGRISQIETHFGLRKIEARGRFVYLNNQRFYLDGILYQPGTATYRQMRRHLRAMRALGCNLVRVHIAGIDPRIYDLADEIGILLWVEVPSPHSSSHRSRANHWAELQRMLVIIGSHPSVVICSLYNEDWGAQDIATSPDTRNYIARVYDYMRLNYPQLLVVDNDGWNHVCTEGNLETHLLTVHIYTPDLDRWRSLLDRFVEGTNVGVTAQPLVVGDPFFYQGQVPLVVSEWGGFGFEGYGGPEDPQSKVERIRAFKEELRRRPIAGDVYTQATSIEDEVNGLIDLETGDLQVPAGILDSSKFAPEAQVETPVGG